MSAAPTRLGTPRRARARPARVVEPRGRLEPRESRSRARPARDEGADDRARAVDAIGRLRAGETGSTMDGTPTRGDGTMRRERDGAMARDASTPTRAMDRAKGGVGEKRRAAAMMTTPTPRAADRGGGAGRGKETPESVVRAPMAGGDTLWSPVAVRASVGGGGGLESPERSGGTPTLGGESGDEETREATMAMPAATATMGDGAEGYTYGTPPSSPSARNSAPACPATPFKARRTRQIGADDSSAPRPRGRVVRSLLEEFDAAERGLEDMLGDTHSENTTLRTLDDGFDPFDDPE